MGVGVGVDALGWFMFDVEGAGRGKKKEKEWTLMIVGDFGNCHVFQCNLLWEPSMTNYLS